MSEFEGNLVQQIMTVQTKAQVFLSAFLSNDAERKARAGQLLRPTDDDWSTVFADDAIDDFKAYYQGFFLANVLPTAKVNQTEIRIAGAYPDLLRTDNPLSARFPGGYRQILPLLKPENVWLSWKFTQPGQRIGMAYDGLVHLPDGRFVWFPKPWRVERTGAKR